MTRQLKLEPTPVQKARDAGVQVAWAHRRVLIPSALYGPLRPLDAIRPYRLEPKAKRAPSRAVARGRG